MSRMLITGAAGFIGSAFLRHALEAGRKEGLRITILDALTYAGHRVNFESLLENEVCEFIQADLRDFGKIQDIFKAKPFDSVVHFAAESHVDNSISGPRAFLETNVFGTFSLLEAARATWSGLTPERQNKFRFVHVSTDEVFGALGETGKFTEETPYSPNSPYSASKAAGDHFAKAWFHTYRLPVIVTNCSNNYGPRHFPEKLIPRMILNALRGEKLPVYGAGANIRDWIHVEDHAAGVWLALQKGRPGESYCFGGRSERTNLDVVRSLCGILDELKPRSEGRKYDELISFVEDRAGHDFRYAIDDTKAESELGFTRKFSDFEEGLRSTVKWYLENQSWVQTVLERKS